MKYSSHDVGRHSPSGVSVTAWTQLVIVQRLILSCQASLEDLMHRLYTNKSAPFTRVVGGKELNDFLCSCGGLWKSLH